MKSLLAMLQQNELAKLVLGMFVLADFECRFPYDSYGRGEHHFGPFWGEDFGAISGSPFFSRPLCVTAEKCWRAFVSRDLFWGTFRRPFAFALGCDVGGGAKRMGGGKRTRERGLPKSFKPLQKSFWSALSLSLHRKKTEH